MIDKQIKTSKLEKALVVGTWGITSALAIGTLLLPYESKALTYVAGATVVSCFITAMIGIPYDRRNRYNRTLCRNDKNRSRSTFFNSRRDRDSKECYDCVYERNNNF